MTSEQIELQRSDSLCPPPETQLLEFVRNNSVLKLKNLIAENPELIDLTIGYPYDKPILHIACYEFAVNVNSDTIKALLELGAGLYQSDELHNHKEALHFAALGQNPDILSTIVEAVGYKNQEKLNSLSGGNTALNLLIKEGIPEKYGFLECVHILVTTGVDVNKSDSKDLSPVFWAAKKNYAEVVRIILRDSRNEVDLDSHTLRNKSARDYILENKIDISNLENAQLANNNEDVPQILFRYIKAGNEDSFVNQGYEYLQQFVDESDGESTLLQLAAERHLKKVVEVLLHYGADANKTTPKNLNTPIEIAAERGFYEIMNMLLNNPGTNISSNLLSSTLKHVDYEISSDHINYELCYRQLMDKCKNLDVNVCDANNSTPLHYVARYGGSEKTLELLRRGASMACKNKYGSLPVEDIDASVLETHLNECLEMQPEQNIDKESFIVSFNYRTLMPPKKLKYYEPTYKEPHDIETASKLITREIQQLTSETQVISYISKSPELRHLLKHPVVTSFLYIKWHRIRWFFYMNLAFYILFCISLILYMLLVYSDQTGKHEQNGFDHFLFILLCVMFVCLALREVFQILVSPKNYFFNLENILECTLIILTAFILFETSLSEDFKRQLAAIAILLAAFELVILIGQHPKMTTNIVMLRTVSLNFFKFLIWYSILIIAFSLSFFILFKENDKDESENATNTEQKEEDQKFFNDPGISLFKTVVMLTGEFDAASINFQSYAITSHIIFMLFVFMIAIILFNLLNGLAVSDTQIIMSNSELVGHIARIEHMAYIESMFLGNLLPKNILNFITKYCCCLPYNFTAKFRAPGILIRRISLFPHYLRDYKLNIYPNQRGRVAYIEYANRLDNGSDQASCVTVNCHNVYLDTQTAKRTKQLMKVRKEATEQDKLEKRILESQQETIDRQQLVIDELRKEQQVILNKLDYIITNISVRY